jgi:hypothetical protein
VIANDVREIRSEIARAEQAREVGKQGGRGNVKTHSADSTERVSKPTVDTRKAVAVENKVPERKIRLAQEIKKVDPVVSAMVLAGDGLLSPNVGLRRCSGW